EQSDQLSPPRTRAPGAIVPDGTVAGAAVSPGIGGGGATLGGPAPGAAASSGAVHPVAMHASGQRAVRQLEAARAIQADARLTKLGYVEAVIIGSAQILALLA